MIEAIKERFAQFEPQAIIDAIIHLIPDLLTIRSEGHSS